MSKKIAIKNNYHKMLSFEALIGNPFSMEGGEIRVVDCNMAIRLLKNVWITRADCEFKPESSCVACEKPKTEVKTEVKIVLKEKSGVKKPINRYDKGRVNNKKLN